MSQVAQQANIKFGKKLEKSAREKFQTMKQAYGEEALGRSAVAQTLCTGERQFGR
jgi:hypothetical protein